MQKSPERRRFTRVRPRGLVPTRAKIVITAKSPAIDCNVIEIAAGGACVDVHGLTEIPSRVTFIHSGSKKASRVVWRKGRRIGLQF